MDDGGDSVFRVWINLETGRFERFETNFWGSGSKSLKKRGLNLGQYPDLVYNEPVFVLTLPFSFPRPLHHNFKTKKMKKVILITGASSGIGKETAKKLIQEGHTVYAVARRIDQMQDLKTMGGHPLQMDVTDEADIETVVQTIIQKEGKLDVLWNNAGYGLYGSVEDVSMEEARKQMEVNVFGLAAVTQKVVPHMRKAKSGLIINTSSMGGKMYFPMGAWYHASKHAVEGLSDCLRLELKQFNINVVVLEPGFIATEFGAVLIDNFSKISKQSVYTDMMNKIIAGTKKTAEKNGSSKPSVIANTVSKIIESDHPKTRYRVGKFAKPMVWMRVYLGDRLFDKIVMSQL